MAEPSGADWFRRFRTPAAPQARLVCLPHACGSASYFRPWAGMMPAGVELFAVQYPGHEDRIRERCLQDLRLLAERVAAAVTALDPLPTVVFGHSLGGAVAFEVTRRLAAAGSAPAGLIVSGRPAPHAVSTPPAQRTDDELWAELARLGGTRSEVMADENLRRFFLPIVRADFRMSTTYRTTAEDTVPCDLLAYRGVSDDDAVHGEVARWADLTTARFRMREFAGEHFYLTPPNPAVVAQLGADVDALLAPALEGRPARG